MQIFLSVNFYSSTVFNWVSNLVYTQYYYMVVRSSDAWSVNDLLYVFKACNFQGNFLSKNYFLRGVNVYRRTHLEMRAVQLLIQRSTSWFLVLSEGW